MTFLLNNNKVNKYTSYVYYYQWDIYLNKKDNIDRIAEVLFLCPYALLFGVDNADWDSLMFILLFNNMYFTLEVHMGFLWWIEFSPPQKKIK
jgi:hypothetical protein